MSLSHVISTTRVNVYSRTLTAIYDIQREYLSDYLLRMTLCRNITFKGEPRNITLYEKVKEVSSLEGIQKECNFLGQFSAADDDTLLTRSHRPRCQLTNTPSMTRRGQCVESSWAVT